MVVRGLEKSFLIKDPREGRAPVWDTRPASEEVTTVEKLHFASRGDIMAFSYFGISLHSLL